jgi:hypothetical protein
MKYAVEMGLSAMLYIPSFIKIGSRIQKLMWGDTQTHRQHGDRIGLLSFFQNKENNLKSTSGPQIVLIYLIMILRISSDYFPK